MYNTGNFIACKKLLYRLLHTCKYRNSYIYIYIYCNNMQQTLLCNFVLYHQYKTSTYYKVHTYVY